MGQPTFFYHHPCRGNGYLEYYAQAQAKAAVARYLAFQSPNVTRFDVDADGRLNAEELRDAILYQRNVSETAVEEGPSEEALRNYARSICFREHELEPGGRRVADWLDLPPDAAFERKPPRTPADILVPRRERDGPRFDFQRRLHEMDQHERL